MLPHCAVDLASHWCLGQLDSPDNSRYRRAMPKLSDMEIALLEDVYGQGDDDGPWNLSQYLAATYERWGEGVTPDVLDHYRSVIQRLAELGYMREVSIAADYVITNDGIDAMREILGQRADPALSAAAFRRSMLLWLYDLERRGLQAHSTQQFRNYPGSSFAGKEPDDNDVQWTTFFLNGRGLIDGSPIMQVKHLASPKITALGLECVESGRPVADFLAGSQQSGHSINIRDSSNIAIETHGIVTQQYSAGIEPKALNDLVRFASSVREGLPLLSLDPEQQAIALSAADELEKAAQETSPDRSRLRSIAGRLLAAIGPATTAGLAGIITAFGQDAIKAIGG